MAANTVVPTPPRATGDPATDMRAIMEWANAFYRALVVESGLLDPSFQQGEPPPFDADNLPQPTSTSISRAQQTANAAIEALKNHSLYP